jgi:cyclic pyranopterin phosphate synthase
MPFEPLTDSLGREQAYLRISVTDRCNFQCVYCMPFEGASWRPKAELMSYEEIVRLACIFRDLGVRKVRLTGGEPTVRKGLESLISGLRAVFGAGALGMTTNGHDLAEKASMYRTAGLSRVNVSLDSLRPERFERITRSRRFRQVLDGIQAALDAGFESVKINVVVMRGRNDDELLDFLELARNDPLEVRFIEYMPFAGNGWCGESMVPYSEMRAAIESKVRLRPLVFERSDVALRFAAEGYKGTVGFIASMTRSFCATCNRLRLTADGKLKTCLFSHREADLLTPLRSGASREELAQTIRQAVLRKPAGHEPLAILPTVPNRSMVQIGG